MRGHLADVINHFISIRSGVLILWGSNFWLSHKKEKSPLTQGLIYRSACDTSTVLLDTAIPTGSSEIIGVVWDKDEHF